MLTKEPSAYEIAMQEYERKIKRDEIIINQFIPLHDRLIDSGTSLIKLLFIMNSGAILALLTFVGNQHTPHLFHKLQCTFEWLIIGVITSVLSGIAEFLRQGYALGDFKRKFNEESTDNKGNSNLILTFLIMARLMGLISFIVFTVSIFKALYILSGEC